MDAIEALRSLADDVEDWLIQVVARFDEQKYERAVSKLKFILTKLPSLKASVTEGSSSAEERNSLLQIVEPKIRECARLVRLVREKHAAMIARESDEQTPAPPSSHFDEMVSKEKEQEAVAEVDQKEAEAEEEEEPQQKKVWNVVDMLGIARFDCVDEDPRMLSVRRGDGLVILKEARGFLFARLLRSGETGIVAASFVESFSNESLLEKYSALSDKVDSLRAERDEAQTASDFFREKAQSVARKVAELKHYHEEEVVLLQRELDEAHGKIDELTVQMSILEAKEEATVTLKVVPEPIPMIASPRRAPIVRRSSSPELKKGSIEQLMGSLDDVLKPRKVRVPIFAGTPESRSLVAICESDNASVPVFLEKMCEHLLANGAVGVKTKGIFRVPPAKAELDEAKKEVMELGVWGFKPEKYSHLLIGDLMKSFLRELSEPLLTHDLFPRWTLATKIKSSAIQIPYVRSLLASLPSENVATIECVLNFLTIAIGLEEHSQLSLANAASLFGPIFLSHDVSSDKKRTDLLSKVKQTGFTPLFARRGKSKDSAESLEHEAVDLRGYFVFVLFFLFPQQKKSEIMSLGVNVVQMLLLHFREIWNRFKSARPFTLVKSIKESGAARSSDELEFKKGVTIGMFQKLDPLYALGECGGQVGRFLIANTKPVEIGE